MTRQSMFRHLSRISEARTQRQIDRELDAMVAEGLLEVIERPDGGRGFLLTAKGREYGQLILKAGH